MRRLLALLVGALLATGLATGLAATPASAADSLTWSAGQAVDRPSGGFSDVSCVSATSCRATGTHGTIWAYDGHSWTPGRRLGGTLTSIDCVSSSFCAAGIAGSGSAGQLAVLSGGHWSVYAARRGIHDGISCASSRFCMFVTRYGPSGSENAYRVWNGSTWSALRELPARYFVTGVSCWTADRCRAVTGHYVAYWSGARWSTRALPATTMNAVDCASGSFCVAITDGGNELTLRDGAWSAPREIAGYGLSQIACPTTSYCVATTLEGESLVYYADRGAWTKPNPVTAEAIRGLSCPSAGSCHAVTDEGSVLTRTTGGWSAADPVNPAFGDPLAVSCATATSCVLVDRTGGARSYDGTSWSAPQRVVSGDDTALSAVSCPTVDFCAAGTQGGAVTFRADGRWSAPQPLFDLSLADLSCASPTLCLAVGSDTAPNGEPPATARLWNGTRWTTHSFGVTNAEVTSAACAGTVCRAGFQRGAVQENAGEGWSAAPSAPLWFNALSCASPSFCMGVGFGPGGADAAYRYDGSSWVDTGAAPPFPIDHVSCASTTLCVANGKHNVASWDGTSWSPLTLLTTGQLTGVACAGSRCLAVDEDGYVYTSS